MASPAKSTWLGSNASHRLLRRPIANERVSSQPRKRMTAYGDLIQLDGSYHDWFEGRGPTCNLMVAVDDSTSQIQVLKFTPVENRRAYFQVMDQYVRAHGRPIRVLTDRHTGVWSGSSKTDFTRAMDQLGIIHSVAMSPQSKGRVERMNRTLQDRLVKAMRLRGISSIEEANRFAQLYIKRFNRTFGRSPQSSENHHRPAPVVHEIELAFTERHRRRVTRELSFSFRGEQYVIRRVPRMGIRTVEICVNLSGEMSVMGPSGRLEFELIE
ncbi:ISNCY family transposase [Qipengyuania sp. XHP0207]|nr:ISNCY family transposase [Qipengyuania sp. XHP0207]MDG5747560.1 ISNCY family transposase [Qipengyuania sp. XHP0207]